MRPMFVVQCSSRVMSTDQAAMDQAAMDQAAARQAATNSFHFCTMYTFSSMMAFQQAMPPMRAS